MDIFGIENEEQFEALALNLFRFQAKDNETYSKYLRFLGKDPDRIKNLAEIPFLPISFFKSHTIISTKVIPQLYFESSGTGSSIRSKHFINDISLYQQSILEGFKRVYGNPSDYTILALLPSYMDNQHSSLIFMVDELMKRSGNMYNGYYKDDFQALSDRIESCKREDRHYIVWGVSYALLQFAEYHKQGLGSNAIVIETGGMKGRGKEMVREELHFILKSRFQVDQIHSEYGMTELLSQAWCKDSKHFHAPPWMKVKIRDIYDPFHFLPEGQAGGINIIDLANINSCSFIATDDIGKRQGNAFEVLGRMDNSDIRGCNLLIQD